MNKHICVREAYDWIYIGNKDNQLTRYEANGLMKYLSHREDKFPCGIIKNVLNYLLI